MPTRVLLEGTAIEPLLAQVREEYGSGVRIISADKVRSGGFGGFFAKQHYELSVEVPDTPAIESAKPRPAKPESAADSLEQLLERAEARDRIVPDEPASTRPSLDRPGFERPALETAARQGRSAGTSDADEAHRRDLADTGAAFAELMAGLDGASHLASSAPIRSAPRPKPAPAQDDKPTVRPFRPAAATEAPVNGGRTGTTGHTGTGRPLPPVPSLAELMGGLGVTEADIPAPPARSAAAAYSLHPTVKPPAVPAPPAAPTSGGPGSHVALREEAGLPAVRVTHSDAVVTNLISVGMPPEMAEEITGGDTYAGVLGVLAARPAAPGIPDAPGEILVLAGDLGHAVPMGKDLLKQAGIDQSHLLLAGPSAAGTGLHSSRVISTVESAKARADKLQSADSAWVVVMDAPVGGTDPIRINDMCEALGATALWAVVDATRKTRDTARHLRTLGDVEALVVHSVELTSDPATVLGLELPIHSLDGKPATPHSWAAMLCARIAADVTPMAAAPRRQARSAR